MLSHLPIQFGDDIKVIILIKKHNEPCSENVCFDDGYTPLTFPFDATYNDYGGIADVSLPDYAFKQLKSANLFISKQDPYKFTTIAQFIDGINQDCMYVKPDDEFLKLECVYIHKALYDTLIDNMAIRKPYEHGRNVITGNYEYKTHKSEISIHTFIFQFTLSYFNSHSRTESDGKIYEDKPF